MKLLGKITLWLLGLMGIAVISLALVLGYSSDCDIPAAGSAGADSMQAVNYYCYGSPEVLQLQEIAKPVPADDEVLVKIQAASVNPLDWHYMRGSPYIMRLMAGIGAPDEPRFGVDFAGTVESVGSQVTLFKPGDEVFGGATGAFAEYAVIRENRAVAIKPASVSFEQAAAQPIAAVSALQALRDKGKVKPGMKVLVNGASGGVGTFAVQIAKSLGAEVTGVCSTRNVELVRALGADHVVDYKLEDYTRGDKEYDLIIDNVGNHSPFANSRALTASGTLVMVGGPGGNWVGPFLRPLQALILSPFVEQRFELFLGKLNQKDLDVLAQLTAAGELAAVIDRRYALADIRDAIEYSESGRARGKIIIDVD